jgi:hypothetical protein
MNKEPQKYFQNKFLTMRHLIPVLLCAAAIFLQACSPSTDQTPLPPATPPLSRSVVGYGVVTDSYTRVLNEPSLDGVALGYVRQGTILRVLEKRLVAKQEAPEYWVLIEGDYQGWLPLEVIAIYDSEGKARTAAED